MKGALGALLLLLGISPASAADLIPVTVGITNTVADVGNFVADRRGYFAAEGLAVRLVPFDAAAMMIAPLASGDLDAGGGGVSAGLFNAVGRGIGLKIVADKSSSPPGLGGGALIIRKDLIDTNIAAPAPAPAPLDPRAWDRSGAKVGMPAENAPAGE